MSVTFTVKNTQQPVLSIAECLALQDNLQQNNIDENDERFDLQDFYQRSLDSIDVLLLKDDQSGRGFELDFAEDEYHVRVNTPTTIHDWQLALSLLQILSKKLNQSISCEDGTDFDTNTILNFNYQADIESGLYSAKQILQERDLKSIELTGVSYTMAFDSSMLDEILADDNPAKAFTQILTANQQLDAYFAKQMIIQQKDSDELIGLYVLSEDVATVFPVQPSVDYGSDIDNQAVTGWNVYFALSDKETPMPIFDYSQFIEKLLAQQDCRWIDAKNVLIYPMNKQKISQYKALLIASYL